MKYVRIYNDEIIGYMPAPNKYQKWYRPIDTYDKKYCRNLLKKENETKEKFTDIELSVNEDRWYYDRNLTLTNAILPLHFPDFSEIKMVVGFFLLDYDILVSPNDWFISGSLKKDTLLYNSVSQYLEKRKPERPNLMYYQKEEHQNLIDSYNRAILWYNS